MSCCSAANAGGGGGRGGNKPASSNSMGNPCLRDPWLGIYMQGRLREATNHWPCCFSKVLMKPLAHAVNDTGRTQASNLHLSSCPEGRTSKSCLLCVFSSTAGVRGCSHRPGDSEELLRPRHHVQAKVYGLLRRPEPRWSATPGAPRRTPPTIFLDCGGPGDGEELLKPKRDVQAKRPPASAAS